MKLRLSRGLLAGSVAVAFLAGGAPGALALPIVTGAVVVDGADPAELPPQFTGQTFTHPNEGANFTVPAFGEDVPTFNDRNHEWNGASASLPIPRYLLGAEYIMFPNDDRDNDPYVVEITLSADADVYLLIDNRHPDGVNTTPPNIEGTMLWVTEDGWQPVRNGLNRRANAEEPDEVGVDEAGDGVGAGNALNQWSSVYHRRILAGTFTLGTPENGGRNMYGVVVRPVPQAPFVSASGGDLLGVVYEVSDGSRSRLKDDSVRLVVDGVDVTGQVQRTDLGNVTRLRYRLTEPFPSLSTHTAVLTFTDDAASPATVTDTLEFTAEYYATLTAADAVPAGAVDTAVSGFTARVVQARDTAAWPGADLPNSTLRGELQLAGLIRDPVSGNWLANSAVAGPDSGGTYTVERINWNQEMTSVGTQVEIGNFQSTSTPAAPDAPVPGIPGTDPESAANLDNVAAEIVGYLELGVGLHRLGVNSDDGFRVTAGADPLNPANVLLGEFSGGRGSADTLFYVKVDAAGIYPVRLLWYEGGGGANVEFFSVHQPNPDQAPSYVLVNARGQANAIASYARSSAGMPPAAAVYPLAGATGVPADARVRAVLRSRGSAVVPGSVQLTVNEAAAAVTTSSVAGGLLVEHVPAGLWPSGATNVARLAYSDAAGNNGVVTWTFVVEDYSGLPVIPAGYAVQANTSTSGFTADVYQMWDGFSAAPVARTGFADNNSPEAAEQQIARGYIDPATGEPYVAFGSPGENPDGTFNVDLVNWNQQFATAGDFNSGTGYEDAIVPGLVVDGDVAENDWIVAECLTYLDLKKGRHRLVVNSDDGFKLTTAPNPGDVLGLTLGVFPTGRGAANTSCDFLVEADGVYPIRLLWWEGTGGASVEFKSQDVVTLAQTLVNDRTRADGLRAYRSITGAAIPRIAAAGPSPGATNVAADTAITVGLENLGATAVQLRVNGVEVTPQRSTAGSITTLTYQPSQPFPFNTEVDVALVRSGTTTAWSFTTGSAAENLLTVAVTSPAAGAKFAADVGSVTVVATAAVQGGTISRVEFFDAASNKLGEDTTAPYEYAWSGILPGRHAVFARAHDNRGLTASSATIHFQVGEPIAVNFQAATAEVPEGYLADYGDVFGDRGNGQTYGWDDDNTAHARDRNDARAPDERYDTFTHMQKTDPLPAGRVWEIAVPNGRYSVFVAAGEAANIDSIYNIAVEGTTVVQGIPTDAVRFYEGSGIVQVADGRISVSNGTGASNNKICFLEIYALPAVTEPPQLGAPVLAGGNLTLTWTNGGTLESAPAATGPWTSTGDSDGSYTEPATAAAKFFRVRR